MESGVYVAKIYSFALSVLALALVLTDFKMDFIFNSVENELACFLYFNIGTYLRSRQYAFCAFEKKHAAALWRVPTTIFFTIISSFTTFVVFFVYYIFTGKNL